MHLLVCESPVIQVIDFSFSRLQREDKKIARFFLNVQGQTGCFSRYRLTLVNCLIEYEADEEDQDDNSEIENDSCSHE